jgi:type I restriction enzyme S subunit
MQRTNINNIPKLRFKEYKDEWHEVQLGSIVIQMQSGLSRKLNNEDIGLPVLRSNNIKEGNIEITDLAYWHIKDPQGANTSNYYLRDGDLLINFINSITQIGKFAIYKNETGRDTIFTTNIMRLKFNQNTSVEFIALRLMSKKYDNFIHSITKPAVNQASFTTVDLKRFKFLIPSKDEQEKIVDFLTAVDEKISALNKKVDLMKKYKKGVMQKLFSQEIRFKDEDGNDFPDWEKNKFGDTYEFLKTNSFSRGLLQETGEVKNIHYGDIHMKLQINFDSSKEKLSFIPSGAHSDYCQIGDLVITDASEDRIDIGKSIEIIKINGDKVVAGLHTFLARPNNKIALGFSAYLMQGMQIRKQLWRIATGVSVLGISKTELSKQLINLPCKEEQKKIADFLTSIEDTILLEEKKLGQAKKIKKYLLQQMFI